MNRKEAAMLLTLVTAYDRRTLGDEDVQAWHAALDDLPLADCQQAVKDHFRSADGWLMPKHVRDGVRRIRTARLALAPTAEALVTADPDDDLAYRSQLADARRAIADGTVVAQPEPGYRPMPALRPGMGSLGQSMREVVPELRSRREVAAAAALDATRAAVAAARLARDTCPAGQEGTT